MLGLDRKLFGQWPRQHRRGGWGGGGPSPHLDVCRAEGRGGGCRLLWLLGPRAGGAAGSGPRGSSPRLTLVVLLCLFGRIRTSVAMMTGHHDGGSNAPEVAHSPLP